MSSKPSTAADRDQRLDELVPAPWPTWWRLVVLGVAVVLAASAITLVRSGAVGPQLRHDSGYGSTVTDAPQGLAAERHSPIINAGWLPVTLEAVELPEVPGITWGEIPGLPVTLEPGADHQLVVPFEAVGCQLDVGGYDVFPIRARSGIAPARVVEVRAPFSAEPRGDGIVVGEDGTETRVPGFPDQPPSWILDTLEPHCADPVPPGVTG